LNAHAITPFLHRQQGILISLGRFEFA
jgi:hypothetical protein